MKERTENQSISSQRVHKEWLTLQLHEALDQHDQWPAHRSFQISWCTLYANGTLLDLKISKIYNNKYCTLIIYVNKHVSKLIVEYLWEGKVDMCHNFKRESQNTRKSKYLFKSNCKDFHINYVSSNYYCKTNFKIVFL